MNFPSERAAGDCPVFFFDLVEDYPAIGGVVEFSTTLRRQLKRHYGDRLVSVRKLASELGLPNASMPYLHRERLVAEHLAARHPDSVFFFPNFQSPIRRQGTGPRIINVLHDVQFAYLPELFTAERRDTLYRTFCETRANADEIVFISQAARSQFLEVIGTPRRDSVIYNPVVANGSTSVDREREAFLLAPIHHHAHKNFSGLLAFFARLAARDPELRLVLTGRGAEALEGQIEALPEDVSRRVSHLGYVSRQRLDTLYGRARALISLSRFEGFNLSAAEAARHGTPLLLSDLPVHRELFSAQACFLDPDAPSLEAAEAFLAEPAHHRAGRWFLSEQCEPACVAGAYAKIIDRQLAEATTALESSQQLGAITGSEMAHASAARRRPTPRKLLAGMVLPSVAAALLLGMSQAAMAEGGTGGGNAVAGGLGGTGYAGNVGADGGSVYFGAGGGGAGGGAGGVGGPSSCYAAATCPGYLPAEGGDGGTALSPDGGDGADADLTYSGGGGGGGGGYHGNGFSGTLAAGGLVEGGKGGKGGSVTVAGRPGGGGGGGAGGYGAVVTGSGAMTSSATIRGGSGGDGGGTLFPIFNGGAGGDGGAGIQFAGGGAVLFTNVGSVTGGNGGQGGIKGVASGSGVNGAAGLGGAGIVGQDLTLINAGTISGGWSGDGVTQADAVTFTGGTNVITFLDATSGLDGGIGVLGAATLTFEQFGDVTLSSTIHGTGSLIKSGAGTLTYTGNSAGFGGSTTISEGLFSVDGTLGGALTVASGGFLGGIGTVASGVGSGVTVASGGTLSPGHSIGTLTVSGDLTFALNANFEVEVDAAGNSDRVHVGGIADLGGATLLVRAENGVDNGSTYAPDTIYEILSSDHAVTGTFGGIAENFAFLDASLDYASDPNKVFLTLTRNDAGLGSVANTPNQRGVAGALAGFDPSGPVSQQLLTLSAEEAQSAYDSVSGEVHASGQHLAGYSFATFQSMLGGAPGSFGATTQIAPLSYGPAPGTAVASLLAIDEIDSPDYPVHSAWLSPMGGRGTVEADGNAAALDWAAAGLAAGYEGRSRIAAGEASYGVGVGYLSGWAEAQDRSSELSSAGIFAGAFGSWTDGAISLKGNLAYGADHIDTTRNISIGAISETALASYWSQSLGLGLEASYAHPLTDAFSIGPVVSLDLGWSGHNGVSETGAGLLNATIEPADFWNLDTGLGIELAYQTELASGGELTLKGRAMWEHAFGDTRPEQTVSLAGGGPAFTVSGPDLGRDHLRLGTGIAFSPDGTTSFSLDYTGTFSDNQTGHAAAAAFKVAF